MERSYLLITRVSLVLSLGLLLPAESDAAVFLQLAGCATTADTCGIGFGDSNGSPEPNEQLVMELTVENLDTEAATNVNAVVTTSTPGVTITQDSSGFGTIPAFSFVIGSPRIQYQLDCDYQCGTDIVFDVAITSDQGNFSDSCSKRTSALCGPCGCVEITKTAASPTVVVGGSVNFTIVVHNTAAVARADGTLTDVLDSCFDPLTSCAADVVCSGGTDCGTCATTADGFTITDFGVAADDSMPGGPDEITFTVTVTAGSVPGNCSNAAETFHSSFKDSATVQILGMAQPDLTITKVASSPTVDLGGTVQFVITIENVGGAPFSGGVLSDQLDACFRPLTDCMTEVTCSGGTDCGTCSITPGGFDITGFALAARDSMPGGPDEIQFTVTATAGSTPGMCSNSAQTSDPDSPSLMDSATVEILAAVPDLTITKVASRPTVGVGGTVDFVITIENVGNAPFMGGSLIDSLDPCFESLTDCMTEVACSGGTDCGTCSLTPGGFEINGFALDASDGMPGGADEIQFTVTATAGSIPGMCGNRGQTSDPDSPSLIDSATVDILAVPDLTITKVALMPTVDVGGTVDFVITIENVGDAPFMGGSLIDTLDPCFESLTDCMTEVACSGGTDCGICSLTPGGFEINGFALDASDGMPGGPDEIQFTVTATAGSTTGMCSNSAETSDPDSPSLTDSATVDIIDAGVPNLTIRKVAQSPTVDAGSTVDFVITIENVGDAPFMGGNLVDTLDSCFESLTDCMTEVSCGGGTDCGTCSLTAGGFDITGFALAARDGMPGGPDQIQVTVTVTAGSTPGMCSNNADTSDPDSPLLTDGDTVEILSAACDLMGDDVTFPPVAPARLPPPWVYTNDCGMGDIRLSNVKQAMAASDIDLGEDFVDTGGTLTLYQIDCGCSTRIALTKNRVSGKVRLWFN